MGGTRELRVLSTALECETCLCFSTAHHQRPVGSLKGCSSFPGTDDKCCHQKLMVGFTLGGLFPPKSFSDSVSPKTGVALGIPSSSAPRPRVPTHPSGVPARREGRRSGSGTGEIPHVEQECHLGLVLSVQPWLWNLLLFYSRKFSPSCQSPSAFFFFFLKLENYVHGSRL